MDRLLIDYLPPALNELREITSLMDAEQLEVETLWNDLANALCDQFAADATENGVKRWEKLLSISPKADDSLNVRKFRILSHLTEKVPFTANNLKMQLDALCGTDGYTVTVDVQNFRVSVLVELTEKKEVDEVNDLLKRIIPANMLFDVSLRYNQHSTLHSYTHAMLKKYMYSQLKDDAGLKINA